MLLLIKKPKYEEGRYAITLTVIYLGSEFKASYMRELADFLFRYPFKVLLKRPSRFYNVKYYHGLRILSSYLIRRQIHIFRSSYT